MVRHGLAGRSMIVGSATTLHPRKGKGSTSDLRWDRGRIDGSGACSIVYAVWEHTQEAIEMTMILEDPRR
jgi:hypothetical protein